MFKFFIQNQEYRERVYLKIKEDFNLKQFFSSLYFNIKMYLKISRLGTSYFAFYKGNESGLGFIDIIPYQVNFSEERIPEFIQEYNYLFPKQSFTGKVLMMIDMNKIKLTYAYSREVA